MQSFGSKVAVRILTTLALCFLDSLTTLKSQHPINEHSVAVIYEVGFRRDTMRYG